MWIRSRGVYLERLKPMLEGIRLTLTDKGYVLALPKEVGDAYTGLVNEVLVGSYVESEILPHLHKDLKNFYPHLHPYRDSLLDNGYSRSEDNLPLLVFEGIKTQGVEIKAGPIHKPQRASSSLNVRSLYDPLLAFKKIHKRGRTIKVFISPFDYERHRGAGYIPSICEETFKFCSPQQRLFF